MLVKSCFMAVVLDLKGIHLFGFHVFTRMLVKSFLMILILYLTSMKVTQSTAIPAHLLAESTRIGQLLARLRIARKVKQTDAALRAGLSRNTVYRIEKGEPGLALGQVLRYLDAIAPGSTLLDLLSERDPALRSLAAREGTKRVRDLTADELSELNF
jgi:transcriptional regulator with XRE-family HTH domain